MISPPRQHKNSNILIVKQWLKRNFKKEKETQMTTNQLWTVDFVLVEYFQISVCFWRREAVAHLQRERVVPHWFSSCLRFPLPGRRKEKKKKPKKNPETNGSTGVRQTPCQSREKANFFLISGSLSHSILTHKQVPLAFILTHTP